MITHDYKLIFIHIPKCAGRSVSEIFNQRFDQYTANYYYMIYARFWNEYEKFAIVRNPYDRLVSMYHYISQHRRHAGEEIANGHNFKIWAMLNFTNFKGLFDIDSPEAERGGDWELGSSHWFSPQIRFLTVPGTFKVPGITIFKYEDGFDQINQWLQQRGVKTEIPHINKSEHKQWKDYYDDELKSFLRDQYFIQSDCKQFNYQIL